jgi:hypothetical protein
MQSKRENKKSGNQEFEYFERLIGEEKNPHLLLAWRFAESDSFLAVGDGRI